MDSLTAPGAVPEQAEPRRRGGLRSFLVLMLSVGALLWLLGSQGRGTPLPDRPTMYEDGSYAFLTPQAYDADVPVTYDHCQPLVVTVNLRGAPPEAEEVVREAMRILGQVSGFTFRWGGRTTDRPLDLRRYGPIAVSWTDQAEVDAMTDDVAGRGGSTWTPIPGQRWWYQTGQVLLSADYFARLSRAGEEDLMLAVVLHELGHVLGLAHVEDSGELMAAQGGALTLGPGDLTGLARLGTQPCRS